jgi:DNA-binding HxlR family transcriptional regulator
MGRTADYSDQRCSVAATLKVIGDPWTLLIIRDAFLGLRRFEQWHEKLGVARNVLAARLKSLSHHGVFEKVAYNQRPPRFEYVLTAKGRDLLPVINAMLGWGDQHIYGPGREPQLYEHTLCERRFVPVTACDCCGEKVRSRDLRRTTSPDALTVGEVMGVLEEA